MAWTSTIPRIIASIPASILSLIGFITITLPSWMFNFFQTSLTLTVNMTTLLLILMLIMSLLTWLLRYRWLNMYTRLPPNPQRKEPPVEVFPDTKDSNSKPGLSNYLDEFLSAIKVFGYLERHVFHELTRTMQTRKLIAGETLLLEEEKGFCLVVDGIVQIFVKSSSNVDDDSADFASVESESYNPGHQGYQLLTEVKNGAPMSSLFSILSLFTDDVSLKQDISTAPQRPTLKKVASHNSLSAIDNASPYNSFDDLTRFASAPGTSSRNGSIPHLSLDENGAEDVISPLSPIKKSYPSPHRRSTIHRPSAHPDIVARASVDTTIAIIPATAFHRLTRLYPCASAHIVQVILTRLQRVTFATGFSYLGLTNEILRLDKAMEKYTCCDLPDFLRGGVLERLKDKFRKEVERVGEADTSRGIALHNSRARQSHTTTSLQKEAMLQARLALVEQQTDTASTSTKSKQEVRPRKSMNPTNIHDQEPQSGVSAGDLLVGTKIRPSSSSAKQPSFSQPYQTPHGPVRGMSNLGSQRGPGATMGPIRRNIPLLRQESRDEDAIFRDAILSCITNAIGLGDAKEETKPVRSVPQSPRMVSYDVKKQKAVFDHAFGLMAAYDNHGDGDSDTSASVSAFSTAGAPFVLEDLRHEVEVVYFPKGSIIVEKGERNPGLYYVIDGFIDVCLAGEDIEPNNNVFGTSPIDSEPQITKIETSFDKRRSPDKKSSATSSEHEKSHKPNRKSIYVTKPGGLIGYIGTVSGHRSFVDIVAKTDVYVGFLPRNVVEKIVEKFPIVLLTLAKRLTNLMPRLILHMDFALEWIQVNAGQVIFNEKEDSDAIYIVLNGRLRAIQEPEDGKTKVIGEFGQGDSIGELEVLTESPRPGTLVAIRDAELARFPKTLFNSLALEHPGITIKISKIIATRMKAFMQHSSIDSSVMGDRLAVKETPKSVSNFRTVTILPVTAGVPVIDFGHKLLTALAQINPSSGAISLNQTAILNHLGRHAFSRMGKLKLSQYLADLEEKYGLVIYIADTNVKSPWTQTCISQADCILLVGMAESSASIGEYERFLLTTKTTARKELVLLHVERYCPPGTTRKWLRSRPWINGGHHHVQMSFRNTVEPMQHQLKRFGSAIKQRVQVIQAEIQKYTSRRVRQTPLYSADTPFKGDFHRLARRLCGKSVGIVLGGGGARGIAHIGVIRALEEAGIPIDIVGGTSIGAFIGALYAWDADVVPMYGRAKKFAGRMGSMWRFALDLTYPSASYTTGHEFNRGIFKTFGDSQIEDFWLDFYCNTTNITKSRSEVHTSGYVWRYVRASMSLAGLIPPLCDEGNMLLDGGYVDNLTVAHMKSLGADVVFAVDVGAIDDDTPQNFGDSLSGFWAFFNRYNPFSAHPNPPTLSEIQARLAYVSSASALERAKTTPGCRYLRPPVEHYGTLEFAKFDEIYQVGYKYGKQFLGQLKEQGVLPVVEETEEKKNLRRTMAPRRASI